MSELVRTDLVERIEQLITEAKKRAVVAVNTAMVYTYYEIGRMIVEDEQKGEHRAEYGKAVIKQLSDRLTRKFGKGFSERNIEQMRQFYVIYSQATPIPQTLFAESSLIPQTMSDQLHFTLSWSHYLKLMRIENPDERKFYEIEATEKKLRELYEKRDEIEKEKEILLAQIENDEKLKGKPDMVKAKMVEGKINKYYDENCLLRQAFVKDPALSIEKLVKSYSDKMGKTLTVKRFTRFEMGEGLEITEPEEARHLIKSKVEELSKIYSV